MAHETPTANQNGQTTLKLIITILFGNIAEFIGLVRVIIIFFSTRIRNAQSTQQKLQRQSSTHSYKKTTQLRSNSAQHKSSTPQRTNREELQDLMKKINTSLKQFSQKKPTQLSSKHSQSAQLLLNEKQKTPISQRNKKEFTSSQDINKLIQQQISKIKKENVAKQPNTPQQPQQGQQIFSYITQVRKNSPKTSNVRLNLSQNSKKPHVYYMSKMAKYYSKHDETDILGQTYRDHFIQTFHSLGFTSVLSPPSEEAIKQKKLSFPRRPSLFQKTVVLDLDETLIHCNESTLIPSDVILTIEFPNGEKIDVNLFDLQILYHIQAGVNVRPYAIELLSQLSSLCELIVFTASHQCYASKVLEHLDPKQKFIHHRIFREGCVTTDEGVHIKDLRILADRDLKDVVLVDNAAYSFGFQVDNGIPIIPYYDNKADRVTIQISNYNKELIDLLEYLKSLFSVNDVRDVNRKTFKIGQYTKHQEIESAIKNILK